MNDISKQVRRFGLILLVHLGVVVIWQLWVNMGEIPDYVMPSPGATLLSLGEDYGWVHNTYVTAMEVFGGYFLAVIAGVGLALIFTWFKVVENLFMLSVTESEYPLAVSVNRAFATSLMHGTTSALVGVALGRLRFGRGPTRVASLLLGWAAAMALHITFNTLVPGATPSRAVGGTRIELSSISIARWSTVISGVATSTV